VIGVSGAIFFFFLKAGRGSGSLLHGWQREGLIGIEVFFWGWGFYFNSGEARTAEGGCLSGIKQVLCDIKLENAKNTL
jgi:hypothetical protein